MHDSHIHTCTHKASLTHNAVTHADSHTFTDIHTIALAQLEGNTQDVTISFLWRVMFWMGSRFLFYFICVLPMVCITYMPYFFLRKSKDVLTKIRVRSFC
jgi:hypothetical protein